MREIRLFLSKNLKLGEPSLLNKEQSHYLTTVLRLKAKDTLQVFNNQGGAFRCVLQNQEKQWLVTPKEFFAEDHLPKAQVQLVLCLLKGEKLEWVLQKVTELGVARVIFLVCKHSVLRLKTSDWQKKFEHWQKIIIAACEQSGRNRLPEFNYAETFEKAWDITENHQALWVTPEAEKSLLTYCLESMPTHLSLWIGCEGGFSQSEAQWLFERTQAVGLGRSVLRAETAAIVAVALAVQGLASYH